MIYSRAHPGMFVRLERERPAQLANDCLKVATVWVVCRCKPILRPRKVREIGVAGLQKRFEQDLVETAAACEPFVPCPKKLKAKRRSWLQFRKKRRREKTVRARHSHEDQGPPAHAQQPLKCRFSMRQPVYLIGDSFTECEKLPHKAVERQVGSRRTGEQCCGTLAQVFLHILQVVAKLQEHTPVKCKPRFDLAEKSVRQARIPRTDVPPLAQLNRSNSGSVAVRQRLTCSMLFSCARWIASRHSYTRGNRSRGYCCSISRTIAQTAVSRGSCGARCRPHRRSRKRELMRAFAASKSFRNRDSCRCRDTADCSQ